jgi:DNA polymerase-3 subunit alpha
VFEALDALTAYSAMTQDALASAQVSLFGEATADLPAPRLPEVDDWAPIDRLAAEHAAVGFYLSGHPLDDYRGPLRRQGVLSHAELLRKAAEASTVAARIAGTVAAVDLRRSARGARYAFVRLSDPTGLFEVRMFSDVLDGARDFLEPGRNVVLTVVATPEGDDLGILAKTAQPIDVALAGAASAGLRLFLAEPDTVPALAKRLDAVTAEARGARSGPIHLVLSDPELVGEVEVALPAPYPLTPQVIGALRSVQGVLHVEEF